MFPVGRQADHWYLAVQVEVPDHVARLRHTGDGITGVDLGVSAAATLSNGEKIAAPRPLAAALRRLRIRSRRQSGKLEAARKTVGIERPILKGTRLPVSKNRACGARVWRASRPRRERGDQSSTARNRRPRGANCATRGEPGGDAGHCRQRWAGGRRESHACQARARSAGRLGAGRGRRTLVRTFSIAVSRRLLPGVTSSENPSKNHCERLCSPAKRSSITKFISTAAKSGGPCRQPCWPFHPPPSARINPTLAASLRPCAASALRSAANAVACTVTTLR